MTQLNPNQATPPPPPPQSPQAGGGGLTVRNWTVICHVSGLVGFVGPLVVWLIKGKDDPQIDTHGKAALNFQISMMIYYAVASVLMLLIIGLFLLPAVGLFDLICIIIGTVKANNGELFNYPLSLKLIK